MLGEYKNEKIISIILSLIMILSNTTALAETSSSIGGNSGGGGGGGSVGGSTAVIQPAQTQKAEYTVSGTISLPVGMAAPEGGLKIYGGFGGVNLSEVSSASLLSSDDYVEEEVEFAYEDYEVIATIPQGSYYTTFSTTCAISTSYDGIYGKFWISDKYVTVPEYPNYPLVSEDGIHWCTESLYTAKRLGLLDHIFYDEIENIDNAAIIKDVIGLFANGQYHLIHADETKFLYICNSGEKYDGVLKAMQSDLYQYYAYSKLNVMAEEELSRIAQVMYD